ncbi:NADH dehydrogenase (ubiquinone) subunit ND-13B [Lycorma delicatula]|uniref:NADH dehydrogenase (ubiquinone) subunit ND-13B n=1 Tax=Lycorma delicatula TaxID=130591 RepID=UPI003F50EC9E
MSKIVKEALKKSTGLTGLKVSRDPHNQLSIVYKKILRTIAKMPSDASYRKCTEEIINKRLHAVNTTTSVEDLEKKVNCGQAEELIQQAVYELDLARKMLTWKPWEPLIQEPPPNQWKWPPVK